LPEQKLKKLRKKRKPLPKKKTPYIKVNYSVVTTSKMKGIKTFNIYNELDVEVTKKMFAKLQELLQNARAKEKTAKDIKLDNYLDPSRQWV